MENRFIKELTNFVAQDEAEEPISFKKINYSKSTPLTLKYTIIIKERMKIRQKMPSPSVMKAIEILNGHYQKFPDIFTTNFETRPRNFSHITSIAAIPGVGGHEYCRSIYEDYTILKHYGGLTVFHEHQFDTSYIARSGDDQRFKRLKGLTDMDKCYIMHLSVSMPKFAKNNRLFLRKICDKKMG